MLSECSSPVSGSSLRRMFTSMKRIFHGVQHQPSPLRPLFRRSLPCLRALPVYLMALTSLRLTTCAPPIMFLVRPARPGAFSSSSPARSRGQTALLPFSRVPDSIATQSTHTVLTGG
eukprot:4155314-Pleurochrysis_carterae.AAC.1